MTISAANQAALEAEHSNRVDFIFLDLAGDPLYACTGTRSYTVLGQDWLAIGEISGISDIATGADAAARPITITASGVDPWIVEPVESRVNYQGRAAIIYRGQTDADGELVDDPYVQWSGRMDVGSMVRSGDTYISQITCEPLSARLLRPNLSRYSDQDHQLRHVGDKFFEFLAEMEKKDVTWGGLTVSPRTYSGGNRPGSRLK